ncbi:hypothetical protein SAMN05421678_11822 [Actinopolymorpha cephalotaxi]|uniref:DNA-binding helix-hairpin-helix protein with protein kinase domain n=1 Tax=Actinopolymorpha cephalotaxi TaxID=504797 RepID=A0A1I3A4A3_9ACTN|nr:hypothetical protein [Actinopolymorpha cephalotaxi]NYH85366.1 DNA-binding helix-hairpin-helix protein with protein kinase domain [Actinopolymorpha cephalotaxi]SFH44579.1 hypothetical protein SAMN05421678_11822 [Actinopolymorpha cephalotaxi]
MTATVQLSSLQIGKELADGGQGRVFELLNRPHQVLKMYHNPAHPGFDAGGLVRLVAERDTISHAGRVADDFAAWPAEVVLKGARTVGFLMLRVPKQFSLRIGRGERLADLSYLATAPKPIWGPVSLPSHSEKLGILRDLAGVVDALHGRGIVLGDISFANVLWTVMPKPRVLLLDCDGMRLEGRRSVLPQADTLDWEDPYVARGAEPTRDQDRYKLALAVLRVLSSSLNRRLDGRPLEPGLLGANPSGVQDLLGKAAGAAGTRPAASEWVTALSDRAMQPVLAPGSRRRIDMPKPKPGLLASGGPRQFRPVQPPS